MRLNLQRLPKKIKIQDKKQMFTSQNKINPKYSQSPVLIRHFISKELSLKILDCVKFKLKDASYEKKINHIIKAKFSEKSDKIIPMKTNGVIVFKNKDNPEYSPKKKIFYTKIFNSMKPNLSQKEIKHLTQTTAENCQKSHFIIKPCQQPEQVQHPLLIFKNQRMSKSCFIKTETKAKQTKQTQLYQSSKPKSSRKQSKQSMEITGSKRKNSAIYNFNRDLSSSRQSRQTSLNAFRKSTLCNILKSSSIPKFQESTFCSQIQQPSNFISINGKKAPSFEINCPYDTFDIQSHKEKLQKYTIKIN